MGLRTELIGGQRVFDVEHRFSGGDEGMQLVALVVGEALLIQRPVEIPDQVGHLIEIVLEAYRQAARMSRGGQRAIEGQLVARGQRESGVVLISIDVVELDSVESFAAA